jgi:hypothetical protein
MEPEYVVASKALPQGFEFHLAPAQSPENSLCGERVAPTQIPPMFWGVESAIEGRWCQRCAAAARAARAAARQAASPAESGDAPCV